jgi:hypothetical protein
MSARLPYAASAPDAVLLHDAALLAAGAPSIHNTQPWRWRTGPDRLDLFLAHDRLLPYTDPVARLAVLSCGASLHHARMELAAAGAHCVVDRLPAPDDPGHLARLRIDRRTSPDPSARWLAEAAGHRRTDRRMRPALPLDTHKLGSIAAATRRVGAELTPIPTRRLTVLAVAMDAARDAMAVTPGLRAERSGWIGGPRLSRAGVPDSALAADPLWPQGVHRDLGRPGRTLISDTHHRAAVFAVLHGGGDERMDWLRAGEALSAGWLTATALEVSVLPLSAVIEVPDSRMAIRQLTDGDGCPYLVLRFAAAVPAADRNRPTPRLPVSAVVDVIADDQA